MGTSTDALLIYGYDLGDACAPSIREVDEYGGLVRARVPGWEQAATTDTWLAEDSDPDYDRAVSVRLGPAHGGPIITGHLSGNVTEVRLRETVDRTEIRQVLDVLTVAGVLPEVAS